MFCLDTLRSFRRLKLSTARSLTLLTMPSSATASTTTEAKNSQVIRDDPSWRADQQGKIIAEKSEHDAMEVDPPPPLAPAAEPTATSSEPAPPPPQARTTFGETSKPTRPTPSRRPPRSSSSGSSRSSTSSAPALAQRGSGDQPPGDVSGPYEP